MIETEKKIKDAILKFGNNTEILDIEKKPWKKLMDKVSLQDVYTAQNLTKLRDLLDLMNNVQHETQQIISELAASGNSGLFTTLIGKHEPIYTYCDLIYDFDTEQIDCIEAPISGKEHADGTLDISKWEETVIECGHTNFMAYSQGNENKAEFENKIKTQWYKPWDDMMRDGFGIRINGYTEHELSQIKNAEANLANADVENNHIAKNAFLKNSKNDKTNTSNDSYIVCTKETKSSFIEAAHKLPSVANKYGYKNKTEAEQYADKIISIIYERTNKQTGEMSSCSFADPRFIAFYKDFMKTESNQSHTDVENDKDKPFDLFSVSENELIKAFAAYLWYQKINQTYDRSMVDLAAELRKRNGCKAYGNDAFVTHKATAKFLHDYFQNKISKSKYIWKDVVLIKNRNIVALEEAPVYDNSPDENSVLLDSYINAVSLKYNANPADIYLLSTDANGDPYQFEELYKSLGIDLDMNLRDYIKQEYLFDINQIGLYNTHVHPNKKTSHPPRISPSIARPVKLAITATNANSIMEHLITYLAHVKYENLLNKVQIDATIKLITETAIVIKTCKSNGKFIKNNSSGEFYTIKNPDFIEFYKENESNPDMFTWA